MDSRRLGDETERTYSVTFKPGEEAISGLGAFARAEEIEFASFTAIGGFEEVSLGFYNETTADFDPIPFEREQVEVLSFIGEITPTDEGPHVHAHVVVGRRDGTTRGGHLLRGAVRPILIVTLTEPEHRPEPHHS